MNKPVKDVRAAGPVLRLSASGRLSIPKAIREAQGWKAGQEFAVVPNFIGHGTAIIEVPTIDELVGLVEGADLGGYRDRDDRTDRYR
jgi:bifunctional DNA-binding transcriptional regulator/antitoxin component of YhaV-PrlF toxin-antitoxin module